MNHLELMNETLVKRFEAKELSGFFSTTIDVPAGTKSLVFENGRNCGEMPPGQYTLQSFMSKLFLSGKNQVIYSCRDENFKVGYSMSCLTKECLRVSVKIQLEYAIENKTLFVQNLVGNRNPYMITDFRVATDALIFAAIQEVIAQFSIKELGTGESCQFLVTSLESFVMSSLSHYGIRFKDALLHSVSHEKFDAMKQQKEELWLVKEGNQIAKEERETKLAAHFDKITDQEKLNDLEILEKQIQNDRNEGELAVAKRRLEYNKNLRKIVQANEFDKLANKSEMEQFLFEQDKTGILREEEKKELLQGIDWAQEEKEIRRQQFLKKLDIQFQHELEDYHTLLIYQAKLATLEQEMELSRKVENEENRKWIAMLEKQKTERKNLLETLSDNLAETLKRGEIAIRQKEIEARLATIDRERRDADAAAELDRQKQAEMMEIELKSSKFEVQKRKAEFLAELDRKEATLAAQLEQDKLAAERAFIIQVVQSLKGMELESAQIVVLSTITKPEMRDTIIKSLEISSRRAEVIAQTQAQTAQAQTQAQNDASKVALDVQTKANEQMMEMMKQMMALQERNADRMVQMNSQSVTAMGNANNGPVVVTPGFPPVQVGGNQQNPPQEEKKVLVCPQCRAEVGANQKFCPNCGKQL